ncbi:hypothetical protein BC826DRAFT_1190404 [Russula brevipes]|nr:hypothetical protein BC826DRAFT_1190404 [Russula brevipes]
MNHLSRPYASSFDVPIIGAVVSVAVQYFLAYRIWVLSNKKSWWLCLAICICSTIDGVAALTGGIYAHVLNKFAGTRALNALAETWLIGNTVSDILITSAMLYLCLRRRGNGQLTDHALSRIVRLTVETNAVTTADGITSLIMLFAFPDRNWFACPTAFIGKLYSNTLLVSLNNRISIRDGVPPGIVHLDLEMSPRSFEGKT